MSKLPLELINLIMSFMSSPTADIFKKEIKEIKDEYDIISPIKFSFSCFYFFNVNKYGYERRKDAALIGGIHLLEYLDKYYTCMFGEYHRKPKYMIFN